MCNTLRRGIFCQLGNYLQTVKFYYFHFQVLPFPLTIVICHLFLKFCLAAICRQIYVQFLGYCKSEVPEERVVLPWNLYLQRVLLVAATSALDIGLSQWSLKYITVALYTMTKTTSILFILGFGLSLGLEKKVKYNVQCISPALQNIGAPPVFCVLTLKY